MPAGDAGLCRSGAAGADKRGLPEIWQRKIAAGVADILLLEQEKELLKEYTSNVFLFCPGATAEAALMSPVPVVTFLPEVSLEKLIEVLSYANISGISGKLVNENITEISAIKALCREIKFR